MGKALREIRGERGLSQEQLGFESEFDRTYISLLERGLQSPTIRTVVRLATVLKISPSCLIKRMEVFLSEGNKQPRKTEPK
ncbi:MAG: helix-turn-helix transcriptional regulator [Acidobacteria bacterium]|nr:helix-turn-helix transcriptional regulator [Acidobacteriota bacterium]